MYFCYEKAREDGEITVGEIEGFNKLMKNLDEKLSSNEIIKVEVNDQLKFPELRKKQKKQWLRKKRKRKSNES